MTINTRRFIAAGFIIAFVICAPILILYTAGYRYNFKKSQLQATGALVLTTKPTGASIQLNETVLTEKTSARLNNILPDEYQITLTKENYYPWTKKMTVNSQQTTFAENILLFRRGEPIKAAEYPIQWINFSPSKQAAIFATTELNQKDLYYFNAVNEHTRLLLNNISDLNNLNAIWTYDDSRILLQTNGRTTLLFPQFQEAPKDLTALIKQNALKNFKWANNSNYLLLGQNDHAIYQLNTLQNKAAVLFTLPAEEKLLDYYVNGQEIFLIKQVGDKTVLTKTSLAADSGNALYKTIELDNKNAKIVGSGQNVLFLDVPRDNSLYLFDLGLSKILFNKSGIRNWDLTNDKVKLLLQTDQELSIIDLSQGTLLEKIITRFSQGLEKAVWHKTDNYVLALRNGQLQIIELDDRDGHFTINLPMDNVTDFMIDAAADNIYFVQGGALWQLIMK